MNRMLNHLPGFVLLPLLAIILVLANLPCECDPSAHTTLLRKPQPTGYLAPVPPPHPPRLAKSEP